MKDKKEVALWSVWCTGLANGALAALFFYVAIGTLDNVFSLGIGTFFSAMVSILLGIGFTTGEYLVHTGEVKHWAVKIGILGMMAAINWGAGFYRSQDNIQAKRAEAVQLAQTDPRYVALIREKANLDSSVVNDGTWKNDADAMRRSKEIDASLIGIVSEYRGEASNRKDTPTATLIISLAFITVNIIFGVAVVAYNRAVAPATATDETPQPQPRAQPSKGRNVAPKRDDRPPQPAPQPQPAFGYAPQQSATNKERILQLHDEGYNFTEIGQKVGCSRQHASATVKKYRRKK